ncbi:hypothetical protein [Martelella limonii]|uniref:hypothetical protein n=1 Tax=Martelella limonii TaxID=1647649 RepID=UPI00158084F9|nr:hypothetical protein [Martelella limonii]
MTGWNFDISAAPQGHHSVSTYKTNTGETRERRDFVPEKVWIATKCEKVFPSYRLENGRWGGLATGEEPIAWMPYDVPVHPDLVEVSV